MAQLNDRQAASVNYISGPLLVLAGAGSGKTSVITQKIAYLIQQCGYQPRHVAAVTFTNKAAREMRERVKSLLQGQSTRGLMISTFHNLGLTILKKDGVHLGLKKEFTLFDATDSESLVKEILQRELPQLSDQARTFQGKISNWKNEILTPQQAQDSAADQESFAAALVYQEYERMLLAYHAVDFDDLILKPVRLFQDNNMILEQWRNRVRYLLVDEYQDTNTSQYELVKMLVGERRQFTVVGDDDQSIYAWRGARPENLELLKADFPALKVIKLEQNYRSTSRILKVANTVIANNPHIFDKALWSNMGIGDPIRVIPCSNDEREVEKIADDITLRHLRDRIPYKKFAVLFRSKFQAQALEFKLRNNQIPYQISGSSSLFDNSEIKDVMAYLRLLINPEDEAAFLRVINTPRREIGPATLEKLSQVAQEMGTYLYDAASRSELRAVLPENASNRLLNFVHWLNQLRQEIYQHSEPTKVIMRMLNDMDFNGFLLQNSASPKQAERRWKNIEALLDSIDYMVKQTDIDDESEVDIETAVRRLLLRDMMERQEDDEEAQGVQLLTLHASKGLEYPHVYIMGVEEEILPHRNSIDEGSIEEERRLMYVGVTRAKETLCMTYARKRRQQGQWHDTTHSRFLDEMPAEDLVWDGKNESSKEERAAHRRSTLDSLYDLLGD